MANQRKFEDYPILSWTIDDWQQFNQAIAQQTTIPNFDFDRYLENYRQNVYERNIQILFNGASIKLNLGGETEKSKLTTTERPIGVFDFSLASRGLYRVQEYYSEKLAEEFPDKFKEFQTPSGVVPPNFVREKYVDGNKEFYFEDKDGYFPCIKEQKGTAAIRNGEKGAKLKYATKTKKVYLTFKKNKGKVKYVEIYSVFYYSTPVDYSLRGDTQFAIRHIPAIMVAEYLESMGIMTRIYMTRFVELEKDYRLREFDEKGNKLPMYDLLGGNQRFRRELFVQPIIVKEFGQDIDKSLAFMVSSSDFDSVYQIMAEYAQNKEVASGNIGTLGYPNFEQDEYFVGIERYRNKYKQYVDLGIFKSKEVLPEAMLFFHDQVIATQLNKFCQRVEEIFRNSLNLRFNDVSEALTHDIVNPFFSWWMKLSANYLKDKINIINSNELQKDIYLMRSDLEKMIQELNQIVNDTSNADFQRFFRAKGQDILRGYRVLNTQGNLNFFQYMTEVTNEITTYADGNIYSTDEETREKRDELVRDVMTIVSALPK